MLFCLLGVVPISHASPEKLWLVPASEMTDRAILSNTQSHSFLSSDIERLDFQLANTSNYVSVLTSLKPDPKGLLRGVKEVKLYKAMSPSVVLITNGEGLGSGSVISKDGKVLTNYHVVGDHETVGVFFKPADSMSTLNKNEVVIGRVIKVDKTKDLALVKLSSTPRSVTPIEIETNTNAYSVGSDVHAIGHPTGQIWTYTKGYISQVRPNFEWSGKEGSPSHKALVIQTQTPINPGNSGGPLLSDEGKLLGVNSFKSANAEGLNFAVASRDVISFLNSPSSTTSTINKQGLCPSTPKEIYSGVNKEENISVTAYDSNCNGKTDFEVRVPSSKERPVLIVFDRNEDGKQDVIVFDDKHDKFFDFSIHDTDFDGRWDLIGNHPDGKLAASSYRAYDIAKVN